MYIRLSILLGLLVASTAVIAQTDQNSKRSGYSFFGIGLNVINYEENSAPQIAESVIDVETNSILNVSQQSGTYVAFNNDWGFYLVSSSTLSESRSDEQWEVDDTSIRDNNISIEQQRIGFLLSKHSCMCSQAWDYTGRFELFVLMV